MGTTIVQLEVAWDDNVRGSQSLLESTSTATLITIATCLHPGAHHGVKLCLLCLCMALMYSLERRHKESPQRRLRVPLLFSV